MENRNLLAGNASAPGGFRLHKLEVFNWGTFDRKVFTVRPAGKSALLIGQNGSGKSTLVDALLTLLVRPGVRNFNVAAGAKKRERDERSYVRGAYDRGNDEAGSGTQVKLLRPKPDFYSVILACFRNSDSGKSFTVAQFLYPTDQNVEKVYCFSEDERSIQEDFSGLESADRVAKKLSNRNFRVTKSFQEFEGWFLRMTHLKAKAMEVFNQTVAVKDIQRLNDFIREHMLERRNWDEKVERLLKHFTELSDAHDTLVRVRHQFELLEPVAEIGSEYRTLAEKVNHTERVLSAVNAYFSQKIIDLFTPALIRRESELVQVRLQKTKLTGEIRDTQESIRNLRNDIERAGGDRLRQIPILIDKEQAFESGKRRAHTAYIHLLGRIGLGSVEIGDETAFAETQKHFAPIHAENERELSKLNGERDRLILDRGDIRKCITELGEELKGLSLRRENIPEWCVALRHGVCNQLGIPPRELPFAAELMQVHPNERRWEPSIEKVLRNFALSLLVPEKCYKLVASHVDRTRLAVLGRGQRLVYLRVAEQPAGDVDAILGDRYLPGKLKLREHRLLPWLKAELRLRFNYLCCDTVEEFQQFHGLAMTESRHAKSGNQRHDKDDREQALNPRNFVLGWDNREKRQHISIEIERLSRSELKITPIIDDIDGQLNVLRDRQAALLEAQRVTCFSDIDFATHERKIQNLESERRAIEENSDTIKMLKAQLHDAELAESSLQESRDGLIALEDRAKKYISEGSLLLSNAQADLKRRDEEGSLTDCRKCFAFLDSECDSPPLSTDDIFDRKDQFRTKQEALSRSQRAAFEPVRDQLTDAMARFLRTNPEETDLRPTAEYLESFLGLRQRIIDDDLPRHERRFKERLNKKVIEEIGFFRSALEQERRGIQEKIELLNQSLRKLEYRPGTHIQLEPRPIRDAQITEFQGKLRECVESSFEDTAEANEVRFLRIRELIVQLRDEGNRSWRDKVTDIRRWFDFVAAVIDRQTLKAVSVYEDSSGQSGGEKAKLAFTILVAAIAYQYDLDPENPISNRFHFVVVDEMFSKVDDQYAEYALELFKQFGLQLLIVAPLDAKARITQPHVGYYMHVIKKENRSAILEMSAKEFEESVVSSTAKDVWAVSELT